MAAKYVPFFESFYIATKDLDDDKRLKAYDAVISYGFTGEVPDFADDPLLKMFWDMSRPNIDATMRRCERNSNAGKASGEARKNKG